MSVWLLSRCFLPQSKHAHIRLIGNLKLSICVSAWLSIPPSTSRSLPSMINWRPGRRVTPSLVSRQLGWTPPSPTKHSACFWIAAGTPHTHSENMQAKTPSPWDPTPFKLHVKKSISLFPPPHLDLSRHVSTGKIQYHSRKIGWDNIFSPTRLYTLISEVFRDIRLLYPLNSGGFPFD